MRQILAQAQNYILLASDEGDPVGYVYMEDISRPSSAATFPRRVLYIHHIVVRPAFRRAGRGRALIEAAKQVARDLGVQTVALDVWTFNSG